MTTPQLAQTYRKLGDLIHSQARETGRAGLPQYATVTTVGAPGSGFDGVNRALFVRWFGQVIQIRYLNSYTPAVGDRVELSYDGTQVVARGSVIG